jgi:glycosyltransferase involved in cell wall biosynthesis
MKPKVLFIIHTPPPVHGAAMVGSYIKNSDHINNNFHTKYIRLGTTNSFEERGKTSFKKIFRFVQLLWTSFSTAFKFRPDVIYMSMTASGIGFYKDAMIALLLKLTGTKLVYHFHNKGVKNRQDKAIDNWLYKSVFDNSDVILLSQYLYPDVEKYVPKERVHFCPNGIPDVMGITRENKSSSKEDPVQILFLSNLLESKGVYVLLKACKQLKEKELSFHCTFVGGEADITAFELEQKIDQLDVGEKVTYAGRKYDEEKEAIFAKSDIFVFPTYYDNETFGLVNLEAMQAKLPVISTPEGGILDVVEDGETGFLVPQKDAEALADKLEELIKDPQKRKEMGQKGFEKYQRAFTLQAFEERFTDILKKLSAHI